MLIRPVAPSGDVSGKQQDSIVFFKWRNAQTARTWARPTNPDSTFQQTVRANLTTLSKRWSNLTAPQRQSWVVYANANPITNRLGVSVRMTGLDAYIALNSVNQLRTSSATFVDTAPATAPPAPILTATLSTGADATTISATLTHGYTTLTGLYVLLRAKTMPSAAVRPFLTQLP